MPAFTPVRPNPASPGYPDHSMPTIFADGALNLAPGAQVVRFYLARSEPNFGNADAYQFVPVAQIVMPTNAFIQTAVFFENAMKKMLENEVITQQQIDTVSGVKASA